MLLISFSLIFHFGNFFLQVAEKKRNKDKIYPFSKHKLFKVIRHCLRICSHLSESQIDLCSVSWRTLLFSNILFPEWVHRNRIPSGIYLKVKTGRSTNDPASYLKVEFSHDLGSRKIQRQSGRSIRLPIMFCVDEAVDKVWKFRNPWQSSPHQ